MIIIMKKEKYRDTSIVYSFMSCLCIVFELQIHLEGVIINGSSPHLCRNYDKECTV